MYASVMPVKTKPDRMDEFISLYQSEVIPGLTEEPGFSGCVVVSARATNSAFVIATWNSKAARKRAVGGNGSAVTAGSLSCLVEDPKPEPFDVLVQAGGRSAGLCARIITLPVPKEHLAAALHVYESEYLPLLKAQAGFLRVMWLANRARGTGWGISFWSRHEQMRAADQEGEFFPQVLARLTAYFSHPPEMGYYVVDVHV